MRVIFYLILLICLTVNVKAQPATFNITVNDTLNLSNWSPRPIEFPEGIYTVAGDGYGLSLSQGGYQQFYQVNEQGVLIQKRIEYDTTRRYFGSSKLIRTSDNNFILTSTRSLLGGTGGNRILVMKISPDLNDTLWSYFHSDSLFFDTTADLIEADNGDIFISARRNLFSNPDSMLGVFIRLNSVGEFINEKIVRERERQFQESIVQLSDGNLLLGGTRGPANSTSINGFLMKISPEGEILWSQDYPQLTECGMSLYDENTIILSGYIFPTGLAKVLIVNANGALIHNKTINYANSSAVPYIGRRTNDGGILSVGLTTNLNFINNNDGYILKTDSVGNLLWQKSYRYTDGDFVEFFTDFIETSDGGILISGSAGESFQNGGQNSWLVKLDSNGCLDPQDCHVSVKDMPLPDAVTIYPNPTTGLFNIKFNEEFSGNISIINYLGQHIKSPEILKRTHSAQLDLSNYSAGIYFVLVRSADGREYKTYKVVKQ